MATQSSADPVRVAVLGGGVAALAAAYELSHPRQQGRFRITVYQLGWRLGGKCASGRDLDRGQGMRIKEHGPHVFFGFYDNAFEMMEECYTAFRPEGHPFRTFEDALVGSNECCVMEDPDGHWVPWPITAVALPGKPGAQGSLSRWEVVLNAIDKFVSHIRSSDQVILDDDRYLEPPEAEHAVRSFNTVLETHCHGCFAAECKEELHRLMGQADADVNFILVKSALQMMVASSDRLQKRSKEIKIARGQVPHEEALALAGDLRCIQGLVHFLASYFVAPSDAVRRWLILGDLGATLLLGATLDELLLPTRQTLLAANRFEYCVWLRRFGALDMSIDSAIVRALYDTVFGYIDGSPRSGRDIEAGSAVRAQFDMLSSRGNFLWKMRAGTGDVVAAPLYECLQRRGVKFEFFHRIERLVPSADARSISEIHIIRQAEVRSEPYRPLLNCGGLTVWPDRPDLSQLKNGQQYEGFDFESYSIPDNPDRLVRKADKHFDAIVLGIGLGGLSSICKRLREADGRWDAMLRNGKTVATQSLQLWMDKPTAASGWAGPPSPVMTAYDATAFDTWLDASHAIAFESWGSNPPAQMAMICGPFPEHQDRHDELELGNSDQGERRTIGADEFLRSSCDIWPNFCSRNTLNPERLRSKFVLPGVNPSDRYVRTPRDSSRFRLSPDRSGFANMVLAGDWTNYGLNLGCFEGAVVSGRLAANALGGQPRRILREDQQPASSGAKRGYVEHHPPQTLGGPVVFPGVTMWTFLLRGQIDVLTGLCRRFFDIPTGGRVTFSPLSQVVVLMVSKLSNAYFMDAPDRGRSTEREVAFAIPGKYACYDAGGKMTAAGVATFMPYLFVDNPVALLTGREVLGYFKQLGEVGLPGRAGGREDFYLNVFGAKRMNAAVEWGEQRLLTIAGRDTTPYSSRQATSFESTGEAGTILTKSMSTIQSALKSILSSQLPGSAVLGIGDVRGLLSGSMSQIFLKQVRAEGSGDAAAYQAVTMAEYKVTNVHSIRPTQSFDITIHPLESLPIAHELGLSSHMIERGVEVTFDMTLGTGRLLWQA
ncbi:NAD(P)-binding protein [Bradyrhizobium manausense]|uniref:NAD(P)-binding protein n=1 Tax=Bradyrhizobium manausense TaxID=989370 RepID=UPI001BAB7FFF|nr:NAD(P)-binding protein [Bradyrhizobium manausense]MBR0829843.1 NAD(P)-binding protein [Bradyrhizobium manausense]